MTGNSNTYYRPEWTCGRYNAKAHAAIYYNLIAGTSFFFEDYSADVIGKFLSLPKNGCVGIEKLSNLTNISEKSLEPFAKQLCELGMLSTSKPNETDICNYRKKSHRAFDETPIPIRGIDNNKGHSELNDAELAYESKVGGITNVMFELTYKCSEQCIHCYNIGASRNGDETNLRNQTRQLSVSDYKRIVDELYEMGLTKVMLSGGDPFSYLGIWELLDYLYSKGIAVDIFTNGISIVGKEKLLAKYYPRRVCLSLYSGIDADHDKITRVKGSWAKTMSVIDSLSKYSIPLVIKCCIIKTNLKSYNSVSEIGRKYGIPVQYELNVTDSIDGDKCVSHYLRLSPEQLEIVLRDPDTVMYVGKDVKDFGGRNIDMESNACKAGYHTFCITPDGNLIPCCAFHLVFGNLRNQSLNDILSNNDLLQWWRNLTVKDYEECGKHDYCAFCNFCVGINYSEHGTPLKAAENNCYVAKIRCRLATKMRNENYDPLLGMSLSERLKILRDLPIEKIHRVYTREH